MIIRNIIIFSIFLFVDFQLVYAAGCSSGAQFKFTNRGCDVIPTNPMELCVSANGLTDCPGSASYTWDFGDGTTTTGRDVCHIYSTPGTYDVTLRLNVSTGLFDCFAHFFMNKTCPTTIQIYISGVSGPFAYDLDTAYNCPENSANLTLNIDDTVNAKWLWNPTYDDIYEVTDFGIVQRPLSNNSKIYTTTQDTNILYVRYFDCEYFDTIILDLLASNTNITSDYNGRDISCFREIDGEVTVTAQKSITPYTFDLNGQIIGPTTSSTALFTLLDTGIHIAKITDGRGCETFDTVSLVEPNPITIQTRIDEDTCGNGDGLIQLFNIQGGTPIYSIVWNNGDTDSLNDNLATGLYYYILQDVNECEYRDTFFLQNRDNPVADFNVLNVCKYDSAQFENNSYVLGDSGGQFGLTYTWSFDDGANSTLENPSHLYASDGTYAVQLIVETEYGCSDTVNKPIEVYPVPVAEAIVIEACEKDTTFLSDASSITSGSIVAWEWTQGANSYTTQNIKIVKNIENTYPYELLMVSNNGCRDSMNSSFFVHHLPFAGFSSSSEEIDLIHNRVFFTNSSQRADLFYWIFDTVGVSTAINPEFYFPNQECKTFQDTLIAETNFGCRDSAYNKIVMKDVLFSYVPNSFTPDGDGVNDIFNVVGDRIDIEGYAFRIFDRWGELIFESNDPAIGWDGTQDNIPVDQGAYIWTINLKAICLLTKETMRGHVILLR